MKQRSTSTSASSHFSVKRRWILLACLLALIIILGVWGFLSSSPNLSARSQSHIDDRDALPESFVRAAQAVVAIEAPRDGGLEHGAGTIINAQGEVLTAYHVVSAAFDAHQPVHVLLRDGRYYTAQVTMGDKASDIALLQITPSEIHNDLPFTSIETIPTVTYGDRVATVGNPLGTGSTHAFGWVAGLNFPLHRLGVDTYGEHVPDSWYVTALQVDMNTSKGNSGGPVFTTDGGFLGIVTAGRIANGMPEGFAYIIPAHIITENLKVLRSDGKIDRPFLGISARRGVYTLNYDTHIGVEVTKVLPNSIAEKAGIRGGDFIVSINDQRVASMNHYVAYTHDLPITRSSSFEIVRNGKVHNFPVDPTTAR